jgi:hypothetical protein
MVGDPGVAVTSCILDMELCTPIVAVFVKIQSSVKVIQLAHTSGIKQKIQSIWVQV